MNFKGSLNESTDDSTEEEDSSRGGCLNESDCGLKARAVIQEEIIKLANLIEEKLLSIQEELSQVEDLYNLECASNFLREVFIDGSLEISESAAIRVNTRSLVETTEQPKIQLYTARQPLVISKERCIAV